MPKKKTQNISDRMQKTEPRPRPLFQKVTLTVEEINERIKKLLRLVNLSHKRAAASKLKF